MIALLAALAVAVTPPFRAEQPDVREGNERLAAGDAEAALRAYARAEQVVGPRAELAFDRGNALARAGRLGDAVAAWKEAAAGADRHLASRAHQNAGNALAAAGDRDAALQAYVEALRADPGNEDARFDLEVLLRRKEPPSPSPSTPPSPQAPAHPERSGREASADSRGPPARRGEREVGQRRAGESRERERGEAGEKREEKPSPLSREEAEALLDALRAREQRMPVGGPRRERTRRGDAEKDW